MNKKCSFSPPFLIFLLLTFLILSGCTTIDESPKAIEIIPTALANTSTPAPTATPGLLEDIVADISETTGVGRVSFLGLTGEGWINLGISLIFVVLGYAAGTILSKIAYRLMVKRTGIESAEVYLKAIASYLKWLVVVLALQFATTRLAFLSPQLKTVLGDIYFVLGLLIVLLAMWKFADYAENWYRQRLAQIGGGEELNPIITIIRRVFLFFIIFISLSLLLSRFGLDTNALTITLGIIGLALSLAARDTVSDAISGFLILADRPFRVGDAIEIENISDWGDVTEIGLRTTRVHTSDNRVVIIPNSIIGKNLVINYSYPDPRYRLETFIRVAYDTDIKAARELITKTIREVEGVVPDESVKILCHEIGEYALVLRVWWWIADYNSTAFVRDRVIEALKVTLEENGIRIAYPIRDLKMQFNPETITKESTEDKQI